MKIIILCGGMGTRLAEETDVIPKPMVEIGGKPILWYIMKHHAYFGFTEFIIALGYKGELIKNVFVNYHFLSDSFTVNTKSGEITEHNKIKDDWKVHLVDTGLDTMTGGFLLKARDLAATAHGVELETCLSKHYESRGLTVFQNLSAIPSAI